MQAYPPDSWRTFFPFLDLWAHLPVEARRAALAARPVYQKLPKALLDLPPRVLEALFESDGKGSHRLAPGFRRVTALLTRLASWSRPEGPDLLAFVQGMTTYPQRLALTGIGSGARPELMASALERRMAEGWFTRVLLDKKTAADFLGAVGHWTPEGLDLTPERYAALRAWMESNLARKRTGFVLVEEGFRVPRSAVPPEEVLTLLIAYGLIFPGALPETMEAVVQIMVPAERPAQGLGRLELKPHAPAETYLRPFLLDDIDAVLRAVKAEPVPLLSDGISAPMAQLRRLGKLFPPLPGFIPSEGLAPEHRALAAWWMIVQMGCLTGSGRTAKTFRAHLNPQGQDWLALAREKKLARVLAEAPTGRREVHRLGDRFSWLGEHAVHPFPYAALQKDALDALDETAARLAGPVDLAALLASAARGANPFTTARERDPLLDGRWARWEEGAETVYGRLLSHHLARLASLGAVAFSRDGVGNVGVSLSDVGRWLYGIAESWTLPGEPRAVAVVGADFTLTFLEPDAGLAAELAAFAEPLGGQGAGAAYRLTKASVQGGVHRGLAAEDMLKVLAAGSRTPLPKNVVHEVKAWAGAKKGLVLRECILVECDDPLALAELRSHMPKDFAAVSPGALRYTGEMGRGALMKRLAKRGFFAE